MKLLVVSRLFSGFAAPLANGQWPPAGAPAIYKLLEGLADDPDIDLDIVFTAKDARTDAMLGDTIRSVTVPRLGLTAPVLRFKSSSLFREASHAWSILRRILRNRPDVVYFTNANLIPAALTARLRLSASVLRFMGLFPHEKKVADGGGRALIRWLYKSPFSLALCTEEGSGAKSYLPRLLGKGVPLNVVLNGVDVGLAAKDERASLCEQHGLPADRPIVLFVGRLETYKGALEFGTAVKQALSAAPESFSAVVVGNGSCRSQLESIQQDLAAGESFLLLGDVPHDKVLAWYRTSDLYVSLNMHGNLSNANLEAIACGVCLVLPASEAATCTDLVTDELIPAEAALRLPRDDLAGSLARVIPGLLQDPARRNAMRAALAQAAPALSQSWAARIGWEVQALKHLADRRRPVNKS